MRLHGYLRSNIAAAKIAHCTAYSGQEHEVNGTGATILPFAVYEVDLALNTISAQIYPAIEKSPYSSWLLQPVRQNLDKSVFATMRNAGLTDQSELITPCYHE